MNNQGKKKKESKMYAEQEKKKNDKVKEGREERARELMMPAGVEEGFGDLLWGYMGRSGGLCCNIGESRKGKDGAGS